mmetsp:Transcript_103827/g.293609  ORF Transcript_103827/g.293609 Transcript_103827/m.293609 type:complete len:221 (+) Transcript_103827:416-1078(+)
MLALSSQRHSPPYLRRPMFDLGRNAWRFIPGAGAAASTRNGQVEPGVLHGAAGSAVLSRVGHAARARRAAGEHDADVWRRWSWRRAPRRRLGPGGAPGGQRPGSGEPAAGLQFRALGAGPAASGPPTAIAALLSCPCSLEPIGRSGPARGPGHCRRDVGRLEAVARRRVGGGANQRSCSCARAPLRRHSRRSSVGALRPGRDFPNCAHGMQSESPKQRLA